MPSRGDSLFHVSDAPAAHVLTIQTRDGGSVRQLDQDILTGGLLGIEEVVGAERSRSRDDTRWSKL
jgi:hypothetical protein